MRVRSGFLIIILLVCFATLISSPVAAQEGDVCDLPNILSSNCRFYGAYIARPGIGQLRPGWSGYFVGPNAPTFGGVTHNAYDPSVGADQRIWTDGVPWTAGVYQVVGNTVPGKGYRAEIGWLVSTNKDALARIGIDPTGGTDPNSANIVWSPTTNVNKGHRSVQATASGSRVSIWIWASIQQTHGADQVWMTAFALVGDQSVPTVAAPTDTPLPVPTNTRAPAPRTALAVPPTNTPTSEPTVAATSTATATATATDTDTPSPTATDTDTPAATATRRPSPTPTPPPVADAIVPNFLAMGLIGASGCSLLFALAMGAFAFWFWRRQ
jgi:hypothetical protein